MVGRVADGDRWAGDRGLLLRPSSLLCGRGMRWVGVDAAAGVAQIPEQTVLVARAAFRRAAWRWRSATGWARSSPTSSSPPRSRYGAHTAESPGALALVNRVAVRGASHRPAAAAMLRPGHRLEVRDRAPRGATTPGGGERTLRRLSQQAGEAEGSLTWRRTGGWQAALTTLGRAGTARRCGSG